MVNAHCHIELSFLRGRIARGCGFAGFADAMSTIRLEATPERRLEAAAYWDAKMFQEGVTAVGDICNAATMFELKLHSKIHYHNFIELFGLRVTDCSPIAAIVEAAEAAHLPFSPTPHAAYSLQDVPFRQVAAAGDPLSIHFMESRGEAELFRGEGPLHDRNVREGITIDFARYGSPARRIVESVAPDKKLLLVHNTFAGRDDIRFIEKHFKGGATWVLCPRSNDFIERARPPAALLHEMGVRVAVGTDSLASNESLSMVEELKMLPDIPLEERLRWATINGARALGIDSWAGSFETGKRPGAVLLTGIDWDAMQLTAASRSRRII